MAKTIKNYKRKIIQLVTLILYNHNFLGFKNSQIYQGPLKNFCAPGLNCYSCPGAVLSCPLGSFQSFLAARMKTSILERIPIYVLGFIILFGVLFGRIICGFLCPFGFIQELLYKIKTKKLKKNKFTRALTYLRYIIILVFVILIPLTVYAPGFCKFICPAGTLEAGIPLVSSVAGLRGAIGFIFFHKVSILILILILSIFIHRVFCRFICPLGLVYGFFNKISIFGIKVDDNKCINCNACEKFCLMDIRKPGDEQCIHCGKCISICPHGAIKWKRFCPSENKLSNKM